MTLPNIAIERLWRSVKCERIYLQEYQNMQELKEDLQNYFHFYNYYRFHQTLRYKKPMEMYNKERFTISSIFKCYRRQHSVKGIKKFGKLS